MAGVQQFLLVQQRVEHAQKIIAFAQMITQRGSIMFSFIVLLFMF
jgi:hypothetical protein